MSLIVDRDVMERMSTDPEEEFRQICICIRMGDVTKARKLYRGVSVNQPLSIWDRRTPLHLAISKKDTAMVRFLLQDCGANPNDSDDKGRTALHIAVLEGNDEIIQLLIDHGGTNFKAVDKWGQSALHLASLCTNTSAAKLLLGHCIECLQYRQQDGITPLQIATMADNKQIAALFSAAAAETASELNAKPQFALLEVNQAGHAEPVSPSSYISPRAAGETQIFVTPQANLIQQSDVAGASEPPENNNLENNNREALKQELIAGSSSTIEDSTTLRNDSHTEAEKSSTSAPEMEGDQPSEATRDAPLIPQDSVAQDDRASIDHTIAPLVIGHEAWQSHMDQLVHHHAHHTLVAELHSATLASYSSELHSTQEELAAVKSLLTDYMVEHTRLASHALFVEELLLNFESERLSVNNLRSDYDRVCSSLKTTENAMSGLLQKMDAMVLQLKRKDSEVQEIRAENSALKAIIAKLEAQKPDSHNENGPVREKVDQISLESISKLSASLTQSNPRFRQKPAEPCDLTKPEENKSDHARRVSPGKKDVDSTSQGESGAWNGPRLALPSSVVLQSACDAGDIWILDWNLTGFVLSSAIDQTTRRIQISLANSDSQPVSDLTDRLGFNKASLGQYSVLFSSPRKSGISPATIYYKGFDSSNVKSDWSATLEDEDILAICLIGRNAAVCSDRGVLRIMSQSGIHLAIVCLDHTAISMASSAYNELAVRMITSAGSYCYVLFDVDLEIRQLDSGACPVSPNCSIIWSGFSEQGLYITLDSSLFVRGLVQKRGSYQWVALLDASAYFTTPRMKIWPLGATSGDLLVVSIQNDSAELPASCRPAPRRLPFKPPTMFIDTQGTQIEQRYLLSSLMIGHYQSQEVAGKLRREDDVACARLLVEQDSALVELFHAAVKENNFSRALDLSTYLRNNLSFARSNQALSDSFV